MTLALRYAARSDVGMVRFKNDDSAYVGRYLAVVADGMGGHAGGNVASASTVLDLVHLDRPDLDDDAVASLRGVIADSGALATTEALIAEHTEQAFTTLAKLAVDETTRSALGSLAHAAVTRTA